MLPRFSVKRPVTITMLILIIIVLGIVSFSRLKVDLMPKIEVPVAIVQTVYPNAGPEEIENMISKPIEDVLETVENIDAISSISSENSSIAIVEFKYGTDMNQATIQMREKIDLIKGSLPEDSEEPIVLKMDLTSMPVLQIAVSGEGDLYTTQKIAEDVIQPRLERIEGTASANVDGGLEREIEIILREDAIKGYNITPSYLTQILKAENLNYPGGNVLKGGNELTVRTVGEFKSVEEIKNLSVPLPKGGTVRLRDIAEINVANKEQSSISRLNGSNVVQLSVMKQTDGNTVNVSKLVNEELDKIRKEYPQLNIVVILDQAEYINLSVENLIKSGVEGALLAVVILYVFLRSVKNTLIIAISMPISVIATFVVLYFMNITLNMLSIGGLALGMGMLVDNAIVILENIYRHRSLGKDMITAAIDGTNEVSMAVTTSTCTSIVVFLPLIFAGGLVSMMFKDFTATVIVSQIVPLLVGLTLVPMLSSRMIAVRHFGTEEEQEKNQGKIIRTYKKFLKWGLNHRFIVVASCVLLFVASIVMISNNGAELFPEMDEGVVTVNVTMPEGTDVKDVNEALDEIRELAGQVPGVEHVLTSAGSGQLLSTGSNTGTAYITLTDLDKREKSSKEIGEEIRKITGDIPGIQLTVSTSSLSMLSSDISLNIAGPDIETLRNIGNDVKGIMDGIEGTSDVEVSMKDGVDQIQIIVDRGIASQYGLTSAQIGSEVRTAVTGSDISTYKVDGDELDIVLKGDSVYKDSISHLETLPIPTSLGSTVPLSEIADIQVLKGPVSIMRENQERIVTVSANTFGRDTKSVSDEIVRKLDEYHMPEGYTYYFEGVTKQMEEAFSDLFLVMIVAIILIYMIIAAQLESYIQPLIIMFAIPLALTGSFIALYVTGIPLNIVGMIGIIVLIGIVVNNSIVLVDYTNTRRAMGEDFYTAVMKAGPIRIRPIMMTALSTVIGLIPLSLGMGEGAELTQQLGIVIIGGMMFSTVLTLVVVPVVYSLFNDLGNFLNKKFRKSTVPVSENK